MQRVGGLQGNTAFNSRIQDIIFLQHITKNYLADFTYIGETLLRVNGAVLVKRNGVYRIEPDARGAHTADVSILASEQLGAGYQLKVIPLQYVGVIDMAEILKPVVPANAILRVDFSRNLIHFFASFRYSLC
jgi:general secretion pathway protein D